MLAGIEERLRAVAAATPREGLVTATPGRAAADGRALLADEAASRPLWGLMVAWKDTFDVAGCLTAAGTRFLGAHPAPRDHALVARVSAAGAVCVGKAALTELACSVLGENEAVEAPVNPFDESRVCGGSSSGSAALVARGLVDAAIGSDCGGSVRLPAAWCGVVGFKPTRYAIDPAGWVPYAPSLDTVGTLTRTVADAAALDTVLSKRDDAPRPLVPVRVVELAVPAAARPSPEVAAVVGPTISRVADATGAGVVWDPFAATSAVRERLGSLAAAEGVSIWRDRVVCAGHLASRRLQETLARPATPAPALLTRMANARRTLIERFRAAVAPGTVLALPACPIPPPRLTALADPRIYAMTYAAAHRLLWPFNELDAPTLTIPCGVTTGGLPVALQLVAPQGRDREVLSAGRLVEQQLTGEPRAS